MKIDTNQIPSEGFTLIEEFNPRDLDLETEIVRFGGKVRVKAKVTKIANAVTVGLNLQGLLRLSCSRCLNEFEAALNKNITLNYPASSVEHIIDLDPDIREEIILDYPIKPLCTEACQGLCLKCGRNLNEGKCSC